MYRALMATEAPLTSDELRHDLEDAGVAIVAENIDASQLALAVVRSAPDLVIAATVSPSNLLFEAARMLGTLAPCPFIMFTNDADAEKIVRASDSGVHAYVVDGYAKHRLLSIIQVARARFRHEQILKDELSGLSQRFEERKLVDRAKGVLMRSRRVTEDEAFELLRSLAMRTRQRIGVVAQSVIDMSRAGEAVNRSGQLRMLSQRIVMCYAQALAGLDAEQAKHILADCIARVDSNLGILRKAISTKGYGDLVDRVAASWHDVLVFCAEPPQIERLDLLNTRAESMLKDAENLTEFLEASGLVSSLHVLNVSGRQRMLTQRISKVCFMLALDPTAERIAHLRALAEQFQGAMDYLGEVPLSSAGIRDNLEAAVVDWTRLRDLLLTLGDPETLDQLSTASERLLDVFERLTDQYEQAMQMLIGDRLGRMG